MNETMCDHISGGAAIARNPQISEELANLEQAIASLDAAQEQVVNQLNPILREEDKRGSGSPCPPDEILVPLADRLRQYRRRIELMTEHLESIYQRIEL